MKRKDENLGRITGVFSLLAYTFSMITFQKIYEFLFHSFRIRSSLDFLRELREENITSVIVVKRSWVYGLYLFLYPLLMSGMVTFSYFLLAQDTFTLLEGGISMGIIVVILLSLLLHILFLFKYSKTREILTLMYEYTTVVESLEKEEKFFSKCFNWITTFYYITVISFLILLIEYAVDKDLTFVHYEIVSVYFFLMVIMAYYRRKMIDLDMDYIIVIPNRIFFVDQMGVYRKAEAVKWLNNIRLISGSYPNFFASLLDYGTIEVTVKNDTQAVTDKYHMHYVSHPSEVVKAMQKIIDETNKA